jgi:hypothetical protein
MMGRREPTVTCRNVAIPEQMNTELTRMAISAVSIPIGGPRISGTRIVAPNIVSTCWRPSPRARANGLGTSSRP